MNILLRYPFLLFIALIAWTHGRHAASAEEQPPNVVLIFADDLGYGDLGCYGATKVQTPNIDSLAAEGRRFSDAHSVSAVCTPSRYALLTGEYPLRANGGRGVWGPAPITSPLIVDTEKTTIADVFKSRGYDTAVVGKWHLGFGKGTNKWQEPLRPGPQDLGFDYYFGMPVVNSAPPYVYVENDRVVGGDPDDPLVYLGRNAKGATPITPIPPEAANRSRNAFGGAKEAHKLFNDYQVGTTFAEKSVEWIRERKDKPFFLYLATTNIHHPFTPAKRFQGTSQCGLYGDFIHELDWIVGEILLCPEDNGLSDNTLVVFTSDNGGMFNFGGQAAFKAGHRQNGDLLGFKFGVWEGGHRVPMIVRWPGKVKAGTTSNRLIGNVDMLATFAALIGQKLNKAQQADSVNMLPAIVGESEKQIRDHLVLAPNKGTHLSVRKGKWMYIPRQGSGGFGGRKPSDHTFAGPAAASFVGSVNSDIEDGKIKKDAPPAQLYDLEADVIQTQNVHNERPEVVKELSSLLAGYKPKPGPGKAKPNTRPGKRNPRAPGKPAKKTAAMPSTRSASFDFESGKLEPWSGTPPLVVAYGMGVDSTAMLIGLHQRGIRPDMILFADTGGEKPDTYLYAPIIRQWLRDVGFPQFEVVRYRPPIANYDSLYGECHQNRTLPGLAFRMKSCSIKWKRQPQDRRVQAWQPARECWDAGHRVRNMIGFDATETRRRYGDRGDDPKYECQYPLMDWCMDRSSSVDRRWPRRSFLSRCR